MIKIGATYKHFKGNEYKVIAIAKHSETEEDMVVYQKLYGDMATWVRPASMWDDIKNGVPRFAEIVAKTATDKKIPIK
ncbi:MAG: DUF1653 domain-containing protein [Alphaproteobacteria bacterium]|nr:DUF1653 domain-containing protein [Alphaproteobacteria bacterium]MCL2758113.1 DUF1653 domain-containing protein [Alphaproteobacteria bacterium]